MAKVVDSANPHRVLFEGPDDEAAAFVAKHEPRPHVMDGRPVPQLKVVEDSAAEEE